MQYRHTMLEGGSRRTPMPSIFHARIAHRALPLMPMATHASARAGHCRWLERLRRAAPIDIAAQAMAMPMAMLVPPPPISNAPAGRRALVRRTGGGWRADDIRPGPPVAVTLNKMLSAQPPPPAVALHMTLRRDGHSRAGRHSRIT